MKRKQHPKYKELKLPLKFTRHEEMDVVSQLEGAFGCNKRMRVHQLNFKITQKKGCPSLLIHRKIEGHQNIILMFS